MNKYKTAALTIAIYALGIIGNAQSLHRYDDFEEYNIGTKDVDYWIEQTCETDPCAGCGVTPFIVTDEQARKGNKSVRMMKVDDDAALTGGDYCGYRTQFANYHDAIFSYNEHAWIGFSVYVADHHLTDQWSQNNIWVFQFKNVDAGGGGNQHGSLKSYAKDRDTAFVWNVEGLGDIGRVKLNQWTDFVFHIYYSTESDGLVEVWKNGEHFYNQGALPAKKECYLAFDIYGDKMDPNDPANKIYFDEIRFLEDKADFNHYDDVMPAYECLETAAPQIPKGITAEATATRQITLNWDNASANTKGILIERKHTDSAYQIISILPASARSFIDKGVKDGNDYVYRLAAFNCYDTSGYSNEHEFTLEKDNTIEIEPRKVSASDFLGSYKPENAIDKNKSTYWMAEGEGEWLGLSFDKYFSPQRVEIQFIHGDSRQYEFELAFSKDSMEWSSSGEYKSSGNTTGAEEYLVPTGQYKYFRYITGTNNEDNRTWLAEISVRGSYASKLSMNDTRRHFTYHTSGSGTIIKLKNDKLLNAKIMVFDLVGKEKYSGNFQEYTHVIPFIGNNGVYIVKIFNEKKTAVQKLYIQ